MKYLVVRGSLLVLFFFVASACQPLQVAPDSPSPTTSTRPSLEFELAGQGFDRPGLVVALPDQRSAVVEQSGTIALLADGSHWLDMRDRIADTAPERGLLGVAFDSDARWVFVSYSRASDAATTLARVPLRDGVPQVAELQEIYVVPQPYPNHNGGHIALVRMDGSTWGSVMVALAMTPTRWRAIHNRHLAN